MLFDRFDGGVDLGARKTEPMHDLLSHCGADFIVAVETDAAGFIDARGRRLADIVKEDAEDEREGDLVRQEREHEAGVLEDVALGMELRRLLAAFQGVDFGQNDLEQAARIEQVPAADALRREKNSHQLLADALGADLADARRRADDGVPRGGLDLELEHGRETNRAQQAEPILGETVRRIADGAEMPAARSSRPPTKSMTSSFGGS